MVLDRPEGSDGCLDVMTVNAFSIFAMDVNHFIHSENRSEFDLTVNISDRVIDLTDDTTIATVGIVTDATIANVGTVSRTVVPKVFIFDCWILTGFSLRPTRNIDAERMARRFRAAQAGFSSSMDYDYFVFPFITRFRETHHFASIILHRSTKVRISGFTYFLSNNMSIDKLLSF